MYNNDTNTDSTLCEKKINYEKKEWYVTKSLLTPTTRDYVRITSVNFLIAVKVQEQAFEQSSDTSYA